jgi:hypothetical protein
MTQSNMTLGSVSYTAPEQLMGASIDGPHRPRDRDPHLAGVDPMIERALAKDPTERISSCREFAEGRSGCSWDRERLR